MGLVEGGDRFHRYSEFSRRRPHPFLSERAPCLLGFPWSYCAGAIFSSDLIVPTTMIVFHPRIFNEKGLGTVGERVNSEVPPSLGSLTVRAIEAWWR